MSTITAPPPTTTAIRRRSAAIPPPILIRRRLSVASRLYSSKTSSSSSNPDGGELHSFPLPPKTASRGAAAVFVALPVDAVAGDGRMTRKKTMAASLMALALAGVEGVAVDMWWGIVERAGPGIYDWRGYLDVVEMARRCRLRVRAVMAFHEWRSGSQWIPLPTWVLEEMDREPELAYSDRFGRRNREYISLGCDTLPVLKGRTPIQAYSDLMRNFRDTFKDFLGTTITEIQVGMGPAGELRYPFCPTLKLMRPDTDPGLGEFQCYDKYMLASLTACARNIGKIDWACGGPHGVSNLSQNPEETPFFSEDGSWKTPYGKFFLEWYCGMLLLHGERLCIVTDAIFWGSGVKISAKVAGIHWYYETSSHPLELTAGYYNTLGRDGYLPIARMFAQYRMTLCCPCFDMRDSEERIKSNSSPEKYLRQLLDAARTYNLPLIGENSLARLDDTSLDQVIRNSRIYFADSYNSSLSFNYIRMNKTLFDSHNWNRFSKFVKRMSDSRTFQARVDLRRSEACLSSALASDEVGRTLIFH